MFNPGLSWDAISKTTRIKYEPIPDYNMNIFFEKGTGGGIGCISNRYSKAKNKYLKPCDSKQESKDVIFLHSNNLFGYAMSKYA